MIFFLLNFFWNMGLLLAFGESSSALILHKLLFVKLGKDANFTKC